MKRARRNFVLASLAIAAAAGLLPSGIAGAQTTLTVVESRVTTSGLYETTPTLGNDGTDDLVVFSSRELLNTAVFDQADIYYQRLVAGQRPLSDPRRTLRARGRGRGDSLARTCGHSSRGDARRSCGYARTPGRNSSANRRARPRTRPGSRQSADA
jgi:hypothetical protein